MRLAIALALSICALATGLANAGQQLLVNGGFEDGTTAWSLTVAPGSGCPAYEGGQALTLDLTPGDGAAFLQQTVGSVAAGAYSFSGFVSLRSGSPQVAASLQWRDEAGSLLPEQSLAVQASSTYAPFTLDTIQAPADARSLVVRVTVIATGAASVCLDGLSLLGPPPATATPSPTPPATATATPAATAVPTSTSMPGATRTAAATSSRTSTAAPAPSLAFTNGGFEDGVKAWQKYGGDLRAVDSPRHSGSAAGALVSNTASTKWAFQTVRVDPGLAYRFSGYLRGGPGVAKAYLRLSWYASEDASGAAIGSDDSTEALNGESDDFVYLSTEAVVPPMGTRSLRARVMLAPVGAGEAPLYLDDLALQVVAPPTATPSPIATSTPAPASTEAATASQREAGRSTAMPTSTTPARPGRTPAQAPAVVDVISPALESVALRAQTPRPTTTAPAARPALDEGGSGGGLHLSLTQAGAGLLLLLASAAAARAFTARRRS